jgi:hypothetical protein
MKQLKGKYNFRDDDPVVDFDLKKLQFPDQNIQYELSKKLNFVMRPLKKIVKGKQ